MNTNDRFQRLISLYIDGEASPEEIQELFDCIKSNQKAKAFFLRCCAIHKTMCKLYGKSATFAKLASFDVEEALENKKPTKLKLFTEWASVAVLFAICVSSMYFALPTNEKDSAKSENNDDNNHLYQAEIAQDIHIGEAEVAIIKIYPKPPVSLAISH